MIMRQTYHDGGSRSRHAAISPVLFVLAIDASGLTPYAARPPDNVTSARSPRSTAPWRNPASPSPDAPADGCARPAGWLGRAEPPDHSPASQDHTDRDSGRRRPAQ